MTANRARTAGLIAACAFACLALAGCYKNVVAATGPASRNYEIHEANLEKDESVWTTDGPRPVDTQRYGTRTTTVDRAKPIPSTKPPKPTTGGY